MADSCMHFSFGSIYVKSEISTTVSYNSIGKICRREHCAQTVW